MPWTDGLQAWTRWSPPDSRPQVSVLPALLPAKRGAACAGVAEGFLYDCRYLCLYLHAGAPFVVQELLQSGCHDLDFSGCAIWI
jgi:hypothetical protein